MAAAFLNHTTAVTAACPSTPGAGVKVSLLLLLLGLDPLPHWLPRPCRRKSLYVPWKCEHERHEYEK